MALVEHSFPLLRWGVDLALKQEGNCVIVRGRSSFETPDESFPDLLGEYRRAPKNWSKKHGGKDLPHLQFANADTDEKLVTFVKRFGPVVVRSVQAETPGTGIRVVEQDLEELRTERTIYKAAVTLTVDLGRDAKQTAAVLDSISTIAHGVQTWPRQLQRERKMRREDVEPKWHFDERALRYVEELSLNARRIEPEEGLDKVSIFSVSADPIDAGHRVLCALLNAFRTRIYRWGDRTVEGPDPDLRYGIRPLLYYILRRTYLGENTVAICANEKCREAFEINRAGDRFCKPDCSRHQRQREYWAASGKLRRVARRTPKRSAVKMSVPKGSAEAILGHRSRHAGPGQIEGRRNAERKN